MCGIYGYIRSLSDKKPLEECLDGLSKLQYRGYDSAGVGAVSNGDVFSFKAVGKVENLSPLVLESKLELKSAIAHTRWATHGGLTENNTHPHIDYKKTLTLVHNGIVENYLELREFLKGKGVIFSSETDTEVVSNLVAYHFNGSVKDALVKTLDQLEGSFALVLMHKDFPDTIFAAARACPLAIGICKSTADVYVSSDPSSFKANTYTVYYLEDDQIAKASEEAFYLYNKDGSSIEKPGKELLVESTASTKGTYDHYMLKEIHQLSFLCRDILEKRREGHTYAFEELSYASETLKKTEHIEIIACGSSFNAGLITKEFLEKATRIQTSVHLASEYRYGYHLDKKNTVAIVISQSGETADTLAALRSRKDTFLKTIALCNVENSTLTRECDYYIPLYVGKEISVCSTKAFIGQLLNLYLLGVHLANLLELPTKELLTELAHIPYTVDDILNKEREIKGMAEKFSLYPHYFLTGRGVMYPVSREAALKLKEISYLPAENLPAGEMKHGPIALIDETMPTIAFLTNDPSSAKTISNLHEIEARGGRLLLFSTKDYSSISKEQILIQKNGKDTFASIPLSIAGQIFAYYLAKKLGREIDFPRNLAKSVTVE